MKRVLAALLLLAFARGASAEEGPAWDLKISAAKPSADQSLVWETKRVVSVDLAAPIKIVGKYTRPEWSLVGANQSAEVIKAAKGEPTITFAVKMKGKKGAIHIIQVGPNGEIEPLDFVVEASLAPGQLVYPVRATGEGRLYEVELPASGFALVEGEKPGEPPVVAVITGTYLREGWKLTRETETISTRAPEGAFTTRASLGALELKTTGPEGEAAFERIGLVFEKSATDDPLVEAPKVWRFTPGLGPALNSYRESGRPDYTAYVVYGKISVNRTLLPNVWDLDANIFMTLLALSKSTPNTTVRFLGANLRAGYTIPGAPKPWTFRIGAGIYYTTMFVTDRVFGYENLIYPQLYPVAGYMLRDGSSVFGYVKYVPTNQGFAPSFSERELAAGVSYRTVAWRRPFSRQTAATVLSLDFSDLVFQPSRKFTVHTNSLSLGYSLSF